MQKAYEVLSDTLQRRTFDAERSRGRGFGFGGFGGGGRYGGGGFGGFGNEDDLFSAFGGFGRNGTSRPGSRR